MFLIISCLQDMVEGEKKIFILFVCLKWSNKRKENQISNLMKVDPFLIFSILGLMIIIPIGFSIDYKPYESCCKSPPTLYLYDDISNGSSLQFSNFVSKAKKSLFIVSRTLFPIDPDYERWILPLKNAVDRGVKVKILTNQIALQEKIPFVDLVVVPNTIQHFFVSFAIADEMRFIYTSQLFGNFSSVLADYFLEFNDCKSIVADAIAIFNFFVDFASNPNISVYPHNYCPGFHYPMLHTTPQGSQIVFGISPNRFVSPGRQSIVSLVRSFFNASHQTIDVFTPSLFPESIRSEDNLPELVMSDQIENSVVSGNCSIRILMSLNEFNSRANLTMSLKKVPNIYMKFSKTEPISPSFYVKNEECLFMPMSFESAISFEIMSIAVKIKDPSIVLKVKKHFKEIWDQSL